MKAWLPAIGGIHRAPTAGAIDLGGTSQEAPARARWTRRRALAVSRGKRSLLALLGLLLCLAGSPLHSSPHVVGYERFHAEAPSAEGGAVLFSELGCANCHGGSAAAVPRKGPKLVDLAPRIGRDWLAAFLRDPESAHEGSTMPAMLHGVADADIAAILAYLGTLGKGVKLGAPRHANAERGSALYHEKGCVACHAPTPDFRPPHGGGNPEASPLAVAHPDLTAKTGLLALAHFLGAPSRYRSDGRMPHLPLDVQESLDIAAHLLDYQGSDPRDADPVTPWPKDDAAVAKGRELVAKANCAACHAIEGQRAAPLAPLPEAPSGADHCLSERPRTGLPHYDLDDGQRTSLLAFLSGDRPAEDRDGRLTLAAMNCYACHERDGIGGPPPETAPFFVGDEALGDSGRLAPPLTGIGRKLRRDWLEGVLAGSEGSRARPYVKTRMPHYAGHAAALADWLAKIDASSGPKPLVERKEELEAGRKLLGTLGGTNCITCHTWGEQRSLGIQALDLASLDRRLRPEWFRDYLLDPAGYRPGTLMPPLWPGGRSTVPEVLGGDAERQIAAIWAFIREGDGLPEGFPDRSSGQFEIVPTDRPAIQRTFFEGAGTKAILVGFPGGISLAYDGLAARPALLWRGPFFDAYHTWFSRHAPFEKPLGEAVVAFSEPPPRSRRFRGYRLDAAGNPTFLFSEDGREVGERFSAEGGKLARTLSWTEGDAPAATHPEGVAVESTGGERTLTFIYSWK